jgi:hypothetical protein
VFHFQGGSYGELRFFPHAVPPRKDACRHADGNGVWRHILQHNRIGTDCHIITNVNCAQYFCAGADVYPIANDGGTTLASVPKTYGYSVADNTVISKDRVAAYNDAAKMINAETVTDRGLTGKFDPSEYFCKQFAGFIESREGYPKPSPTNLITPSPEAIDSHYPQALTRKLLVVCSPIFPQVIEHNRLPEQRGNGLPSGACFSAL